MKVVHLVGGTLAGGAARGALWLHKGLLKLGVDSNLLVQSGLTENEPAVFVNENTFVRKAKAKIIEKLEQFPLVFYPKRDQRLLFSTGIFGSGVDYSELFDKSDIIHLHWINNGFISLRMISNMRKPVIWTIRDAWPFTGGCHVLHNCRQFEYGCGKCPLLGSRKKIDLSFLIYKRKQKILKKQTFQPVAISHWIKKRAQKSDLFRNINIEIIHNCIDTENFFPIPGKRNLKQLLSIPFEKKVVLFGAGNFHNNSNKGYDLFLAAIRLLEKQNTYILLFGSNDIGGLGSLGFEYRTLGFLKDNLSLRLAYSAADVFVAPSREESFGKTIAESMACGTPVVAFNATGPMDIIDHKENGYLARPFQPSDLAKGIQWILKDDDRYKKLAHCAVKKIESSFTKEMQALKYMDLYKKTGLSD